MWEPGTHQQNFASLFGSYLALMIIKQLLLLLLIINCKALDDRGVICYKVYSWVGSARGLRKLWGPKIVSCFPLGTSYEESACQCRRHRVTGSIHASGRSPGVGNGTPLQYSPGKFHGQKNLAGYSSWGHKELDTTQQLSTHTQDCVSCAHSHAKGWLAQKAQISARSVRLRSPFSSINCILKSRICDQISNSKGEGENTAQIIGAKKGEGKTAKRIQCWRRYTEAAVGSWEGASSGPIYNSG